MKQLQNGLTVNEEAMRLFEIQLKLTVNERLYQQGAITEEMYIKAKEIILKC